MALQFLKDGLFTGTLTVQDRASTTSQALVYIDGKRTNGTDGVFGELVFLNNGDSVATVAAFRDTADNKGSLVFQTQNGAAGFGTRLTIAADGNATFGNNIYGNSSNTTEIGLFDTSVSPAVTAAIKRIRMAQGGEIHFGDTTALAPLGITEGNWDSFGDNDFLSIYGRSSIRLYSGALASAGTLRLTLSTTSDFEGEVNATGNITTDGIFKVDSAPDNNILEVDQSGRKMALKTSFAANTTDSFWALKVSTGAADGTMTDALVLKPLLATFAGNVTIETGINLESGTLVIKNATSDSSGLKIFQDSSDASKIHNNYNGTLQLGVNNTTSLTLGSSNVANFAGNISFPNSDLSSTAPPTNFGVYNSEIRLIETPNGGLKQCRVITDNYGEWILVGRFAASAMNTIANGATWSSVSGLSLGTAQNETTQFSADFGDSYPTEVRIMGATDFTKWRDTRTVDFIYGVPEGRQWKFFFSGGVENGMALSTKYGWGINGAYDGFGRWVNTAQTFVRMSDGNVTNPSAAYTTATTNAFNWDGADDAKITVSATRAFSGQDTYLTAGFGNDDNIYGFFDEYPGEAFNMNGGVDFSSAAWILIKLPNASSGGGGGGDTFWSESGTDIYNTNSGNVAIGATDPGDVKLFVENPNASTNPVFQTKLDTAYSLGISNEWVSQYVSKLRIGRLTSGNVSNIDLIYDIAGTEYASIKRNYGASSLKFERGGTTDMTIDGSGNVGIGKTTSLTSHRLSILKDASNQQLGCYYNETSFAAFGARSSGDVQIYGWNGSSYRNILLGVDGSAVGGNVGIGTVSPNQQLELMGNNAYTSKTRFSYGVGATNYFADWGYNSDGNKVYLTITDGGVAKDVIVADYTGNVGIGTDSPDTRLHVVGPDGAVNPPSYSVFDVTIENSGQSDLGIIGTTYSGIYFGDAASALEGALVYSHSDNHMSFRTNGNSEKMRITSAGNVGIGVTDPDSRLDINAGVSATTAGPAVRISKGASPVGLIAYDTLVIEANDVPTIRFGESDGTVSTIMSGDNNMRINSTDPIKFYTAGTTTGQGHGGQGGTFAMIINNSQNVGIGTTSPGYPLDVFSVEVAARFTGSQTGYTQGAILLSSGTADTPQVRGQGVYRFNEGNDDTWYTGTAYANTNKYIWARKASTTSFDSGTASLTYAMMTLTNDGKLGIGTTSPDAQLQVKTASYLNTNAVANFINGNNPVRVVYDTVVVAQTDVATLSLVETVTGAQSSEQKLTFSVGDANAVIRSTSTVTNGMYFLVGASTSAPGYQTTSGVLGIRILNSGFVGVGANVPRSKLEIFRAAGSSGTPQLIISTGEGSSRDYSFGTDVMAAGDFAILDGVTSTTANVRMRFVDGGTVIAFRDNNTTELGRYVSTASGGSIKRIRMCQGGEIHFGDTATSNPLGITEGTWDQFTDTDLMSIYARNRLNIYAYPTGNTISASFVSGTFTAVGDVVAYGSPSDKRLKENIKPIESALDKVSKLQGVTFDWKKSDSILEIKEDIGFIAQDVRKVIPELVRENEDGMLSMRHQGIAPILLEAIKELKAEIEELKKHKCDCKK